MRFLLSRVVVSLSATTLLANRRRGFAAALAFVLLSFGLVKVLGFSLFPNADIPQFRIAVEAPTGASLAETDRAVRYIEAELARREEIKHVFEKFGDELKKETLCREITEKAIDSISAKILKLNNSELKIVLEK